MNEPITDEEALSVLTVHALNQLYQEGTCCPECCWPCDVLKRLSDRPDGPDSLDAIVARFPDNPATYAWWTGESVDRDKLAKCWTRTWCHTYGKDADD